MSEDILLKKDGVKKSAKEKTGSFLNDDFLLQSNAAKELYHDYAKDLPIIDYHCHLSPEAIAENKPYANMTDIWLAGDHYKWRALRTLGIDEKYITGDATDEEKFRTWAKAVPYTMRNPLYHWTHMELKNPFGVTELLSEANASEIYAHCNKLLQKPEFSPQGLLEHFKVEMVGTTDDPVDSLNYHQQVAASSFGVKVLPSFRPDKALNLSGGEAFRTYLQQLADASQTSITSIDTLLEALQSRVDYFHQHGCRISDHGLSSLPYVGKSSGNLEKAFAAVLSGDDREAALHQEEFTAFVLLELSKMYHQKGWVQQFHVGALRNTNSRMLQVNGPDTGYDSIGDFSQAAAMAAFFNALEKEGKLTKTVIYNLNPADNAAFATMVGNFQSAGTKGKMQFGSAWWFLDNLEGMQDQMNALSNMGLISCFVGMLTDSRSFLSYSRHEYFRRLLCNMFGNDIAQGLLPADIPWIGKMVQDICYYNAKNYFPI
ncbi:glucuronate isomerase [Pontibacter diazotrophicus]|uniref:Uronate isomerase n=1 Tax=Pontibacter diazotrophicus TaxID=1400979 RepID=A0A3D8LBK9_9BACT|nr:glucuronate isomerase [Pontibacter diazotrophicus]RDV14696.1 glucuronate isomerase [Pontibacter diazotrophicus]